MANGSQSVTCVTENAEVPVKWALDDVTHAARSRRWPTGEEEGARIDSGDDPVAPLYSDEQRAELKRAWIKLTSEEQELLARWRKQNLE